MSGLLILLGVCVLLVSAIYVGSIVREALRPPRASTAWGLARGLPVAPEDLGLSSRSWATQCGMPVWEIDLGSEEEGTSSAVVLIHGWARSRIDMLGRLPPLLDRADRAYLVDLRGHGDAPRRTTLGAAEFEDLVAFVADLPASRILLVGHSLGATLAVRAAADERVASRVAGVLAIAPYRTIATPIGSRLRERQLPRGPALRLALAILRMLGAPAIDTLPAARRLRCPLLVLHGERDRVVPSDEGRAIAEAAPSGRYEGFANTEHAGHERDEPDRFAALASDFASDALSARAS